MARRQIVSPVACARRAPRCYRGWFGPSFRSADGVAASGGTSRLARRGRDRLSALSQLLRRQLATRRDDAGDVRIPRRRGRGAAGGAVAQSHAAARDAAPRLHRRPGWSSAGAPDRRRHARRPAALARRRDHACRGDRRDGIGQVDRAPRPDGRCTAPRRPPGGRRSRRSRDERVSSPPATSSSIRSTAAAPAGTC